MKQRLLNACAPRPGAAERKSEARRFLGPDRIQHRSSLYRQSPVTLQRAMLPSAAGRSQAGDLQFEMANVLAKLCLAGALNFTRVGVVRPLHCRGIHPDMTVTVNVTQAPAADCVICHILDEVAQTPLSGAAYVAGIAADFVR